MRGASPCKNQNTGVKITTLATNSEGGVKYERKCSCCSGTCIDLASCDKFKAIGIDERNKIVQKTCIYVSIALRVSICLRIVENHKSVR